MKLEVKYAQITLVRIMSGGVLNVRLQFTAPDSFHYNAGQYVEMLLGDGKGRIFSIASSPDCGDILEFHLRDVESGVLEQLLLHHFEEGIDVALGSPKGEYRLDIKSSRPLIMLAGGTGFAPVKSMLEFGIQHGIRRKVMLYWGARTRDELYSDELLSTWARDNAWFDYVPVLSDASWSGRTGYVHEALLEDIPSLVGHEVYASGSPQMIKASYDAFIAHGLAEEDYYSDVLEYAKTLS